MKKECRSRGLPAPAGKLLNSKEPPSCRHEAPFLQTVCKGLIGQRVFRVLIFERDGGTPGVYEPPSWCHIGDAPDLLVREPEQRAHGFPVALLKGMEHDEMGVLQDAGGIGTAKKIGGVLHDPCGDALPDPAHLPHLA